MTPAQLNIYARAYAQRYQDEQRVSQANIYSLAALIRVMVWSKNPPDYDTAFPDKKPTPKEMDDDQMYAAVRRLNALFGGEEVD